MLKASPDISLIESLAAERGYSITVLMERAGMNYNTFKRLKAAESCRLDTLGYIAQALGVPLWKLIVYRDNGNGDKPQAPWVDKA